MRETSNPYLRDSLVESLGSGGKVRQAPSQRGAVTDAVGSTGVGIAQQAAGAGAGAALGGVSMATDYLGGKLKPKEEQPTYGGEFGDYTDQFGRRFQSAGPGIKGGAVRGAGYGAMAGGAGAAVGALVGAIVGAAKKHATSAYSDFRNEDAAQAIAAIYKNELGRDASPEEIATHLANQGSKPGDRWVGEKGLNYVLGQIRNSPEADAYKRQAVIDQLAPPKGQTPGFVPSGPPGAATPISVEQAQQHHATDQASQDAGRAAFNAETDRLKSIGWDGRNETRGGSEPVARPLGQAPKDAGFGPGVMGRPDFDTSKLGGNTGIAGGLKSTQIGQVGDVATPGGGAPNPPQKYALEGFGGVTDQGASKLSTSNSPKYQFARIAEKYNPQQGLTPQMLAELNALGIGTFSGQGDKLHIDGGSPEFNGISDFDVVRDIEGGGGWHWEPAGGAGGGDATPGVSSGGLSSGLGSSLSADPLGGLGDGSVLEQIMAEIRRIQSGQVDRNGLISQLGGGNG